MGDDNLAERFCVDAARAVLACLRTPDEAMKAAGHREGEDWIANPEQAATIFTAMIDEVLEGESEASDPEESRTD